MGYYTERNGMRKPIEKTYDIDIGKYGILFRCCEKYFDNIAWKFPKECEDGYGVCGFDKWMFADEIKYEIPDLFTNESGEVAAPVIHHNIFSGDSIDEYNQFALLDLIEFMWANVKDVEKESFHKFFGHWHYETLETNAVAREFREEINIVFSKTGLLFTLTEKGQVERVIENDAAASTSIINTVLSVQEKGTRELLQEAIEKHQSHDPKDIRDSVEKLWDAYERLKTYYTNLNKSQSAKKIIEEMSGGEQAYIDLFDKEFKALTDVGNDFRIRHHEMNKIEIRDISHYDYFFNRCLSLMALAIKCLK